jgi:ring-1,2-phenylacetyl-CoA epoxidase subunit PaaD
MRKATGMSLATKAFFSVMFKIMITEKEIYEALCHVHDPEIPVLNVMDLGMITGVGVTGDGIWVKMIPTFAACPAVDFIRKEIREELEKRLSVSVRVERDPSVRWNSNRLSERAHEKLRHFKIAPPEKLSPDAEGNHTWQMEMLTGVECPHCGSGNTYLRSLFGSTLCRALHYCKDCGHVFEHFKPME